MKKILLTLIHILFLITTFAQNIPQGINYQAIARDTNGNIMVNQTLTVKLSIISDTSAGHISWQETHSVITNDYGLFTTVIGKGTNTSVGYSFMFEQIDWGVTSHFLKVEIDYGNGFVDMGTSALLSVPYALQAGNSAFTFYSNSWTPGSPPGSGIQSPSNTASGIRSTAMGWYTRSSGSYSTSMGSFTQARGNYSTAIGNNSIADGFHSTAIGYNSRANASYSTAIGWDARANSPYSFAIGKYNIGGGDTTSWISNDPIFEIGNGYPQNRSNAFTILKNGKTGINTATPEAGLDIHATGALIQMENETTGHKWEFYTGGSVGNDGLGIYDRTAGSYRLVIDNGGKIGIGTVNPSLKLHVDGGSDASLSGGGYIITNSESSTNIVIDDNEIMARNNGAEAPLYLQNSGTSHQVGGNPTSNNAPVIIGPELTMLSAPSFSNYISKLQVNGIIAMSLCPTWNGSGSYDVTWDYNTGKISREGSSQRFKKNIRPMQADFSKILKIEPKDYQMKEGYGPKGEWAYGYIAEELDQLGLKKLVTYDKQGNPDGVHYKKISIYNLEIIKEQQKILEEQKKMIIQLQREVEKLKNK